MRPCVGKVMSVLHAFTVEDHEVGSAELKRHTRLPKATLHRVSADLESTRRQTRSTVAVTWRSPLRTRHAGLRRATSDRGGHAPAAWPARRRTRPSTRSARRGGRRRRCGVLPESGAGSRVSVCAPAPVIKAVDQKNVPLSLTVYTLMMDSNRVRREVLWTSRRPLPDRAHTSAGAGSPRLPHLPHGGNR